MTVISVVLVAAYIGGFVLVLYALRPLGTVRRLVAAAVVAAAWPLVAAVLLFGVFFGEVVIPALRSVLDVASRSQR